MPSPEKPDLASFLDDAQGYDEAIGMQWRGVFPMRPMYSEAVISCAALTNAICNTNGSPVTYVVQGVIAGMALSCEYGSRVAHNTLARRYVRKLDTKYSFAVAQDPTLPRGIAVTGPLHYDWPPKSYGGIERDLVGIVEGMSDKGIPTYVFGPKTSEAINDIEHAHLIPVIDRPLSAQNLSAEERAAKEVFVAKRIARGIRYLIDVEAIESIDNRWENADFVNMLRRMSWRRGCGLLNVLSCHPNDEIAAITRDNWYDGRSQNTALSYAHHDEISLRRILEGWQNNAPEHGQAYDPLWVMPYGVSFRQAPAPRFESLATSEEQPDIPLLQRLKAQGLDYVVQIAGISPAKLQASAIQAFKGALELGLENTVLVIAGVPSNSEAESIAYFEQEVLPQVDNHRIFYFGSASEQQKWELFGYAKASLFCSGMETSYTEAFGRVIAESMGMGTPVVGVNSPTFQELNAPGVTGLAFKTTQEASRALLRVSEINRTECAALARDRYDIRRMVDWSVRMHTNLTQSARGVEI